MHVKSVSVRGLFGVFDHEIPLENQDRVTIVLGPNGFGKTVMLRMIAALAEGTTAIFQNTPFEEFCISLEDGTARIVRRTILFEGEIKKPRVRLEFFVRSAEGRLSQVSQSAPPTNIPRSLLAAVDARVPPPFRLRGDVWTDTEGHKYQLSEILQRFPLAAAALPQKYHPRFFSDESDGLEVFFVETNRLEPALTRPWTPTQAEQVLVRDVHRTYYRDEARFYYSDEPDQASTRVMQYSEDLVQRIRSVLADYARHSQESDRTFPERLVRFERDGLSALEAHEILARMRELEKKRQRLISLGLLDTETGLRDLTEDDVTRGKDALTIYVGDVQQKLNVFDDIAQRIGILMDIINTRFRYKSLAIDRETGFRVLTDKKEHIRLEDLSSGEQHELVVLYELLFRAPQNGLVLVDEPEISLHVAWQSRFLSDLIEILKLTHSYALVATHSPVIIGARPDLAVELRGPEIAARS